MQGENQFLWTNVQTVTISAYLSRHFGEKPTKKKKILFYLLHIFYFHASYT